MRRGDMMARDDGRVGSIRILDGRSTPVASSGLVHSGPVHSNEAFPAEKSKNPFSPLKYIHVIEVPAGAAGRMLELCGG